MEIEEDEKKNLLKTHATVIKGINRIKRRGRGMTQNWNMYVFLRSTILDL